LTDGPEPLKENDLRTAAFVIEVFGEDLVSTRLFISFAAKGATILKK